MLKNIFRIYVEAMSSWGWIVVVLALSCSITSLWQLGERIEKLGTTSFIVVKVKYRFDRFDDPMDLFPTHWGSLAAFVRQSVSLGSKEFSNVDVSYKEFDLDGNKSIDLGVLKLRSSDDEALEGVMSKIVPRVDEQIRKLFTEQFQHVSVIMKAIEKNYDITSISSVPDGSTSVENIRGIVASYASLVRQHRCLEEKLSSDLPGVRTIVRTKKHTDLVMEKDLKDIAPKVVVFSLICSMLVVFIFVIGLFRVREISKDAF